MMRISTAQIHQQAMNAVLKQQRDVSNIQLQIAGGKRVLSPSDDPVASAKIVNLKAEIAKNQQYIQNIDNANTSLNQEETVINGVVDVFQRVHELMVMGASDTLGQSERESIIQELSLRQNELLNLANTRNASGEYIFAGFKGNMQPFTKNAAGQWLYTGDEGQRLIQVGRHSQVAISDSGQRIFNMIDSGNGTFEVDANAANTGVGVIDIGTLVDPGAYVADTYTIRFVTNSAGELAYQVMDSSAAQVIPALPNDPILDAPAFVDGSDITFLGMKTKITGQPVAGDEFTVSPSKNISIFNIIDNAIVTLAKTDNARHNHIGKVLTNLETVVDQLSDVRASIGARLNILDTEEAVSKNAKLVTQQTLSNVEDLDIMSAVSLLTQRTVALQAAQQSYLRMQNLSLFDLF